MRTTDDSMGEVDDLLYFSDAITDENIPDSLSALPGKVDDDQIVATTPGSLAESSSDLQHPLSTAGEDSMDWPDVTESSKIASLRDLQAVARSYIERGFSIVRLDPASKHNRDRMVQTRDYPPECFGPNDNIGIRAGAPSGGIADLDFDDTLTAQLAHHFLPETSSFGRPGKQGSHRLIRVPGAGKIRLFKFRLGSRLLAEIRGDGHMFMAPPSIHPDRELLEWESDAEPVEMTYDEAHRFVGKACLATVVVERWRDETPGRHDFMLALDGSLLRRGWTEAEVEHLIRVVHTYAQPDHLEESLRGLRSTAEKIRNGERVTGRAVLEEQLGPEFTRALGKWFPAAAPAPTVPAVNDTRPVINAGELDLQHLAAQSWAALVSANSPARIFFDGNRLVRLRFHDDGSPPTVEPLSEDLLSFELVRAAHWVKITKDGSRAVPPPVRVLKHLLADPNPPLPTLVRIVSTPVFAGSGELQTTPGYNLGTRTYFHPSPGLVIPPVSSNPSSDDLRRARGLIDELLLDFPFVTQADRTNAVGMFLLLFVRDMVLGPTPLHLFEAPTAGSGKDLLAEVLAWPALGMLPSSMPYSKYPEELRKKITAMLRPLPAAVLMANVNDKLDSGDLCDAISRPWWEDRLLGASETVRSAVRCLWIATANNPAMSKELARRTVRIRIDAQMEQPWERTAFRHLDLRSWVQAQRGELIWASLTLIQHWIAAGKPSGTAKLGGFEQWAGVIGGILQASGYPAFLDNREALYQEADSETGPWAALVESWAATYGTDVVGTALLFQLALEIDGFDFGRGSEQAQRTSFGMQLAKQRDAIYGEHQILYAGKYQGARQWRLGSRPGGPPPGGADDLPPGEGEPRNLGEPFSDDGEKHTSHQGDLSDTKHGTHVEESEKGSPRFLGSLPPFEVVATDAALTAALPALQGARVLGLDVETTGLDPLGHGLRLIQLATADCVYLIDAQTVDVTLLEPMFATGTSTFIGHGLDFDLGFLAAAGLPTPAGDRLFDTLLASQIMNGGVPQLKGFHALAGLARRFLGLQLDKAMQTSDWDGQLSEEQLAYAALDSAVLLPLHEKLSADLSHARLDATARCEFAALPRMVEMKLTGAPFDATAWGGLADAAEDELRAVEVDLAALVPGFNPRSAKQVKEVLAARGIYVVDTQADTLREVQNRCAVSDPVVALLLRHKAASKRASTFGRKFLDHVHPKTGRIHADFHQIGAASGRMSCSDPNLQNIPHGAEYRGCFRPGSGRVLVKADYAQIELRIAAQITKDRALRAAFQAGEDLHTATARAVLDRDLVDGDRNLAKALNFGLLYGMGAERLRSYAKDQYGVELSLADARRFRERFFQTYPGLRAWHRRQTNGSTTTRTLLGRTRRGVTSFTEKLNSPVQGTGADILKLALGRLHSDRAAVPSADLVLVVHDEIVMEVDVAEAETCKQWLQRHMEAAGAEVLSDVPVVVEAAIMADWSGTPVMLPDESSPSRSRDEPGPDEQQRGRRR